MEFKEGIKLNTVDFVASIDGADYISWAAALALAGRPRQRVRQFEGRPYLSFFDGAVVCVDQNLPAAQTLQETWLPVLDAKMAPVRLDHIDPRVVSDHIMRAKAKAIAMINGVGMSLYNGMGGNALAFIKTLGLTPDSDLAKSQPLESKKNGKAEYVSWAAAVSAARLTDPGFTWRVDFSEAVDWHTGELRTLPVISMPGGYMVSVTVTYKGDEHTELLPIMGIKEVQTKRGLIKMDHQPLPKPDVFDWNKAVMRCLAKAIAIVSGYGLSTYSGEDIDSISKARETIPARKSAEAQSQAQEVISGAQPLDALIAPQAAVPDLVQEIEALLPLDEAKRERIFKACVVRGLVHKQPTSAAELVELSREAAQQVLTGLRAQASKTETKA